MRLPISLGLLLMTVRIRVLWAACLLFRRLGVVMLIFAIASGLGLTVLSDSPGEVLVSFSIALTIAIIIALFSPPKSAVEPVLWPALFEALDRQPEYLAELHKIARDFRVALPRALAPTLNMLTARQLSHEPDRIRDLAIPLPCVGVWSVFELRCHAAHAMVRRGPSFRQIEVGLGWLNLEISSWVPTAPIRRVVSHLLLRTARAIESWHLLANIEADRAVALRYGTGLVSSWIEKTWQAELAVPGFLNSFVAPALNRGILMPIGESYASLQEFLSPLWENVIRSKDQNVYRTRLENLRSTVEVRSVFDSRPAASNFAKLEELEERAARCEFRVGPGVVLRRTVLAEYGETVLIPFMRDEVSRNAPVLDGWKVKDLPDLARRVSAIGDRYSPPPHLLLDQRQREAMVPQLLIAFLSLELIERGWKLTQETWGGPRLSRDHQNIDSSQVVRQLIAQNLAPGDFEQLIQEASGPSESGR